MILLEKRELEEVIGLEQLGVCRPLQTEKSTLLPFRTQEYLEGLLVLVWVVQEAV